MSKYRAGTLNDIDVLSRDIKAMRRNIHEANLPSKTQTYNTSGKISEDMQDLSGIYARLSALETRATTLETNVKKAQDTAEKARLPIGSTMYMSSKKPPTLFGTWTYLGAINQELTTSEIITLHLYTRTV